MVALLVLQPDVGQTMLIAIVWGALFFMAGVPIFWVVGLGGVGRRRPGCRLLRRPACRARIERFLDPATGDTFQVDIATEASCAAACSAGARAKAW